MDTIVVFTRKNVEEMIKNGGSGNWSVKADRLSKCSYLVATANSYDTGSKHARDKHESAFLVGRISGISSVHGDEKRKIIHFDSYAEVETPDVWTGQPNPVRYADLSQLGIDPNDLEWIPFPFDQVQGVDLSTDQTPALTIDEAKRGVARTLGIDPGCIEISIKV